MATEFLGGFGDLSVHVVVTAPPWYENCYLVTHTPSASLTVIDPGGDAPKILDAIKAIGATPRAIWLTHGHGDHLGAAKALEDAFDIRTYAHRDENSTIAGAGGLIQKITGETPILPARVTPFEGEPELDLGGHCVRVIHTPGHTPGGVVYDFGAFAMTGDTLFRQGVGRTDLPGGNRRTLVHSITRLLDEKLDNTDTVLFSGHDASWTVGEARPWWACAAPNLM